MKKRLILTGRGNNDYAFAAAMALRRYPDADLLGMSMGRLPDYLENVSGYEEILLLGIGLTADPKHLAQSLLKLKRKNVAVSWFTAIDFPDCIGEDIRSCLIPYVMTDTDLLDVVTQNFKQDYNELEKFWDEKTTLGQNYLKLIEASEYFYRNYQDEQAYPNVIRRLAAKDPESAWNSAEHQMLEHYLRYGGRELVGQSSAIEELRRKIDLIAPHDHARVLILGESGTGKETVALQIHFKSKRCEEPLIAFNCASVTPGLMESRFLGHTKGAFTGALDTRPGIFEAANGGTLFLDEVSELPMEAQGILLRVLEEGRFQRVGDSIKEIAVNVRVIAATNRDLPTLVKEGKFRADLYQRLCVIQLQMPSLRERKEDIPLIANSYRHRNNIPGVLTARQVEALQNYDYPGNVRELLNLLERAYVLEVTDYQELINEHRRMNAGLQLLSSSELPENLEKAMALHTRNIYQKYNSVTKTAEAMGITRNTVKKYLDALKE